MGPAGTGKSYLLNALIELMRSHGLVVAKLAPSGVAAHLIGGQTIYHFFSLDIECNSTLEHGTTQVTLLRKTDVVVIHSSNRSWGSGHVLLLGDPAQLPAVSRMDIFGTTLWRQFSVLLLREVKHAEDPVFASTLAKVRMGTWDEEVNSTLLS